MTALSLSCGMWDLVPWPGIEPGCSSLRAQRVSHWTSRETPCVFSCVSVFSFLALVCVCVWSLCVSLCASLFLSSKVSPSLSPCVYLSLFPLSVHFFLCLWVSACLSLAVPLTPSVCASGYVSGPWSPWSRHLCVLARGDSTLLLLCSCAAPTPSSPASPTPNRPPCPQE